MKALFIYPEFPETFWSLRHAIKFLGVKALGPPLALLTVAAMLPQEWEKKLVDLNVEPLTAEHLAWADLAFVSAMTVQSPSADGVIRRCRAAGVKVCAGGVHYSTPGALFEPVDHLFIGEAEELLPIFSADLAQGQALPEYRASRFPSLARSPVPAWELLNHNHYMNMLVQVCRGCPHDCDFCHVIVQYGRLPRYKEPEQVVAEIQGLYDSGWRRDITFADDNFICHHGKAKAILRAVSRWQAEHGYPFLFVAQASLEVVDDPELLPLMSQAGFVGLFLGIETPDPASLQECNKRQNLNRDLVGAVRTIQAHGIEVSGGFIVGFDSDTPNVFDHQADFIEEAAIPTAMINLLTAPPGTRLYRRLESEGRLLGDSDGDTAMNADCLNFTPKMDRQQLLDGYRTLLGRLFDPEPFYQRVLTFLGHYRPNPHVRARPPTHREVLAVLKIILALGFKESGRRAFWSFLGRLLLNHRQLFPIGISIAAVGLHYRMMTHRFCAMHQEPAPGMITAADLQKEPFSCLDQPQEAKAWQSEDVEKPGEMNINQPLSEKSAILIHASAAEK
jgi:radical SAM superfamily enzyme YgiQ (UPF0313 family)